MSERQLERVSYHGDTLEAVRDGEAVWVSLRRCCENLGLAMQRQLEKLKSKAWASVTEKVTQLEGDKQSRAYAMLSLDSLPMWLATIDVRKVKPEIREKLTRYQREAAKVLADHFFGRKASLSQELIKAVSLIVDSKLGEFAEQTLDRVDGYIQRAIADRGMIPTREPHWTIRQRVNELGWFNPSAMQMRRIRNIANGLISSALGEIPVIFERDFHYTNRQLAYLDRAIYTILQEAEGRSREGLFGNNR